MPCVILVPMKDHAQAKSRLALLLDTRERGLLAQAMLEDLIGVLQAIPGPVVAVTNGTGAAARAAAAGWRVLWEERPVSESASVDAASRLLAQEGVGAVLRLPADLPLLQTRDVAEVLSRAAAAPSAVLAPSRDRTGTNALLRRPPDLFPSRFGSGSFSHHLAEAARANAHVAIVENPRLALDLDEASDIARFLEHPPEGHTYRLLQRLNIHERLARHDAQSDTHSWD